MKRSAAFLLAGAIATASAPAAHADEPGAGAEADASPGGLSERLLEQRVSGALRTDYFRSSRNLDGASDLFGATVQVKALPRISESLDGKLELRLSDATKSAETRSRFLEAYATAHFDKADVRIGRQIVAWGRADGINPTDNLTPRDYVVLLPFEDDQRFGTTAVKLDAFLSQEYTVTAFATPFFEPSRIPLPAGGLAVAEKIPARTLSNTEVGLKLNEVGDGFDWSVSAFRGFSPLPNIRFVANGPAQPVMELNYGRISVLGADFARNYGRFGVRGEVAYVDTADDVAAIPGVRKPYLSWIAGVDRTFFENLNINLQFFQRRIRRYRNPENIADPAERGVAIQNAVLSGQRDRLNNGVSFRVSDKWFNNTLEAEIFAVVNLTRGDRFIRPLLTYAFTDHWKGSVGAELYRGAADTQFGSLKSGRGRLAEMRYDF